MTVSDSETDLTPQFSRDAVEVLDRTEAFKGFFTMLRLRLRHRLFLGGWSDPFERELFVRDPAVGVLLYDPRNDLVGLTEQFRVGALERPGGPWCLEVVAGMVEEGEPLEEVARREVREEAGLEVGRLHFVRSYMPSPGGSSERLHLYCALVDLSEAGGHFGLLHENEDIRLRVFPRGLVLESVAGCGPVGSGPDSCPIDNAATIICMQWLQLNLAGLRESG